MSIGKPPEQVKVTRTGHFKAVVAQAKMAGPSPMKTQPVAPPVYRPQPLPRVVQEKKAHQLSARLVQPVGKLPSAPQVYRPQTKPNGVRQKPAPVMQMKSHPAAPPVYRPQPLPRVLQRKQPVAPPVNGSKALPSVANRPQAAHGTLPARQTGGPVIQRGHSTRPPIAAASVRPEVLPARVLPVHQRLAQPKTLPVFTPTRLSHLRVAQTKSAGSSRPARLVVQMRVNGVIQMFCETCNSLGEDPDHSPKKCPYFLLDEGEENLSEKKKKVKVQEKVKQQKEDDQAKKKVAEEQAKEINKELAKEKKEKEEDDKLNLGKNLIPVVVTPAPGNQLGDLNNINKTNYPEVYLQTMINIGNTVTTQPVILSHNQGTVKETWEGTVSLGQHYVVVHYHPRAPIVQGALSGESRVHVKGDRGSKTHKYITSQTLTQVNLPADLQVE